MYTYEKKKVKISNNFFIYKLVYLIIMLHYHIENIILNTGFKFNLKNRNKKFIEIYTSLQLYYICYYHII